jgi:redox-sensing transcriptional repressor
MSDGLKITPATLKRLPIYLRILKEKSKEEYISSTTIAENLRISSIQVRKDLASISKVSGTSKKGFKISELIAQIEEFMGIEKSHIAVLVGAGKLGQALLHHEGFENDIKIIFAFDKDEEKCDNIRVFNMDKLQELVRDEHVDIGVITTPKDVAQEACDKLIESGVRAIWNFAPTLLKVPKGVVVKNEDLSASLLLLAKQLENKED